MVGSLFVGAITTGLVSCQTVTVRFSYCHVLDCPLTVKALFAMASKSFGLPFLLVLIVQQPKRLVCIIVVKIYMMIQTCQLFCK